MPRSHNAVSRAATLVALLAFFFSSAWLLAAASDELSFDDVQAKTAEFHRYEKNIVLTPEQEAIKKEALSAIPAPCCSDNSIYTCCCPCNMARSVWGLSHYLIAEKGYGVAEVRAKAEEWIRTIGPDGFSGNVCYTAGGCNRPFAKNGCGGMSEARVIF